MRAAVGKVFAWQYANTDSFFNLLILAFRKADPVNFARLEVSFPLEAMALRMWNASLDPDQFFRDWGFPIPGDVS